MPALEWETWATAETFKVGGQRHVFHVMGRIKTADCVNASHGFGQTSRDTVWRLCASQFPHTLGSIPLGPLSVQMV